MTTDNSGRRGVGPKISIVTPSYNQVEFLEQTIRSVLQQGYPELEYVVIDGASSDGSTECLDRCSSALHYCVSERDDGLGHALNKGFAHTTGDVMAWLNSDDMYTPWALGVVAEIFQRFPHVEWLMGLNAWWNRNGVMTKVRRVNKNMYDYLLGDFAWIQQESVFWRRSLWDKAGGHIDQTYELMVDGELWTRFFLHAPLYTVDAVLGGYRSHGTNRAKLHYDRCLMEMRRAIAGMVPLVDPQTLTIAKILASLRVEKRRVGQPHLDDMELCRRYGAGAVNAFVAASYHHIAWHEGDWVEARTRFRL